MSSQYPWWDKWACTWKGHRDVVSGATITYKLAHPDDKMTVTPMVCGRCGATRPSVPLITVSVPPADSIEGDASEVIQAAIDRANSYGGQAVVPFKGGTYKVSRPISDIGRLRLESGT